MFDLETHCSGIKMNLTSRIYRDKSNRFSRNLFADSRKCSRKTFDSYHHRSDEFWRVQPLKNSRESHLYSTSLGTFDIFQSFHFDGTCTFSIYNVDSRFSEMPGNFLPPAGNCIGIYSKTDASHLGATVSRKLFSELSFRKSRNASRWNVFLWLICYYRYWHL